MLDSSNRGDVGGAGRISNDNNYWKNKFSGSAGPSFGGRFGGPSRMGSGLNGGMNFTGGMNRGFGGGGGFGRPSGFGQSMLPSFMGGNNQLMQGQPSFRPPFNSAQQTPQYMQASQPDPSGALATNPAGYGNDVRSMPWQGQDNGTDRASAQPDLSSLLQMLRNAPSGIMGGNPNMALGNQRNGWDANGNWNQGPGQQIQGGPVPGMNFQLPFNGAPWGMSQPVLGHVNEDMPPMASVAPSFNPNVENAWRRNWSNDNVNRAY